MDEQPVAAEEAVGRPSSGIQSMSRSPRTVIRVYAAYGLALVGNQLFTLLLFFVLSAPQVGLVNWATATGALAFYVLEGGVDTTITVSTRRDPVSVRTLVLVVGCFRAVAAAVALALWLVGLNLHWFGPDEGLILLVVGVTSMVHILATPFTSALQVRNLQALVAELSLIPMGLRLLLLATLWALKLVSPPMIVLASLAAEISLLLAVALAAHRLVPRSSAENTPRPIFAEILKRAPVVAGSQLFMMGQARVDWVLVAALASYTALASYSIANKGMELIALAGSIFGRAALPWFVDGWDARLNQYVRWLSGVGIAGGLAMAVFGWPLLHLVLREKYASAAPVIPVLAAIAPGMLLFQVVQFASFGKGQNLQVMAATGIGFASQILVDVTTIPTLGIFGAALGMCAFIATGYPVLLILAVRQGVVSGVTAAELAAGAAALPLLLTTWTALRM